MTDYPFVCTRVAAPQAIFFGFFRWFLMFFSWKLQIFNSVCMKYSQNFRLWIFPERIETPAGPSKLCKNPRRAGGGSVLLSQTPAGPNPRRTLIWLKTPGRRGLRGLYPRRMHHWIWQYELTVSWIWINQWVNWLLQVCIIMERVWDFKYHSLTKCAS